jgi:uncharacterized membrane protein
MPSDSTNPAQTRARIRLRQVATDRPWVWLSLGWQDLMAQKSVGLVYGGALAVLGWVLAWVMLQLGLAWAILPAVAGFFMLAPLAAAGLYEVSRRREQGLDTGLDEAMAGFHRNGGQIALMGVVLLLINLVWVRIAGLLFALFFGLNFAPSLAELPLRMLQSEAFLPFIIIGTGFGALLAAGSFAVSVISIPMLVDRDVSVLEAVSVSLRVVRENPRAMALWAGLIVLFTGLALVPFFLGLVVAMPLIGHASWHAYRDLVEVS